MPPDPFAPVASQTINDPETLDVVLTVLRKHGVAKFTRGGFSVEFFPGPSPAETRALMRELEEKAPATVVNATESAVEPRVEPVRHDLEDILPAGVQ